MEKLSNLELLRLLEIVEEGLAICDNDLEGVTGEYGFLLEEAEEMIKKALRVK